jgi:uncharacterized protein with PIN domain
MPHVTTLSDIALQIASELKSITSQLKLKREALKKQLNELDSVLAAMDHVDSRASSFYTTATIKGYDHCPNCWVREEIKSPLTAVGHHPDQEDENGEDLLNCHRCETDYAVTDGSWRLL